MSAKRKILLTGAAGRIGTAYRKHAGEQYEFRLVDVNAVADPESHEAVTTDLANLDAARQACAGIQTVIHLAANPHTNADFYKDLLENNFKATYNLFRAAKDAGCERVIFASSVNAVGGYPPERQVRETDAPCPGNVYGVSKAFGESLGAYFAQGEKLSNICIRIGAVVDAGKLSPETNAHIRSIVISMSDLCHLLDRCVETPDVLYAVVHGVSNNRHNWLSITETSRLLDYHPTDDAFTF